MSSESVGPLLRYIRKLSADRKDGELPDHQLLERFATFRDESAFAALLRRHGPMVLSVCQSVLHNLHDAEDVFQAVFLVLAQKPGSIQRREAVSSWLYGVAYRLSLKAKANAARRKICEKRAVVMPSADPLLDLNLRELRGVLYEELNRLPENYRSPLVLCYLEEKTQEEAARLLGWSKGAVIGRLQRGRELLRKRLRQRGLTLSVSLAASALSLGSVSAAVPAALTASTLQAALKLAAGKTTAAGLVSAQVAALVEGASTMMFVNQAKIATVLLLTLSAGLAGFVAVRHGVRAADSPEEAKAAKAPKSADRPAIAKETKPEPRDSLTVRGRVLDPDGKPLLGAKLYLAKTTQARRELSQQADSGPDGRFHFAVPKSDLDGKRRALLCKIMAVAKGYGCAWVNLCQTEEELTLRLAEEAPVSGRILDPDGKPVAGAKLTVDGVSVRTDAKQKGLVFVHKVPSSDGDVYVYGDITKAKSWIGSLPGQASVLTTAADGRFRLNGIGHNRVVSLHLEGPGIATVDLGVAAGAAVDYLAAPSRPIRGVIRDKETGKPLAGATLWLHWWFNPRCEEPRWGKAVTDKEGRYELLGLAKASSYNLRVKPARGQLYFQRDIQLQDIAGLEPLTADIDLVQGLTVRGKVTDKATGKPVAGAVVDYHPLWGNPNVNRKLKDVWWPRSEAVTGSDGSYALTVLPGAGVIGVVGPNPDAYRTAWVTLKERKDFFKVPLVWDDDEGGMKPAVGGNAGGVPVMQNDYNALVLLEPGESDKSLVKDIALERPVERKGRVVGPDGQPIVGVTVSGLLPRWNYETLKGDEFTVRGLNPKAKRQLVFQHGKRNLGLCLKELPDEKLGPLIVKLQPRGSISGRLVDQDGQPVAGVSTRGRGGLEITTDKEGRFHVEGLVPGMKYTIMRPKVVATVLVQVVAEPGKNKDLGDLKLRVDK